MSTAHAHTHDHARLRELSGDPTNTEGLRRRFLRAMRRRFRALRGQVREAAGYDDDVFHLAQDSRLADADDVERFPTNAGKTRAFIAWLREDIHACIDGLHWVAYSGRPERVYDVTEWAAYAAVDGAIIARGTVAGVQVDDRTETAALDVEPPARVFPTSERAES